MVNYLYALFFIFTFALEAISVNLPAKMNVSVPPAKAKESIVVEVSIIRLAWQKVEANSFQVGDVPTPVAFVEEHVAIPGSDQDATIVSTYRITLPPAPAGLYVLPGVSATIGGVRIFANQVSYQVITPEKSKSLLLEALVVEKPPFYPGEKLTLQYRISFQKPIQLTKEVLPLLSMPGFETVGTPSISTAQEQEYTVQVISQKARTSDTGEFHSGISSLEGYIYTEGSLGEKVYVSPLLLAEAPDIVIQVEPFPEEGKPLSFNGALGAFYWRIKLLGSGSVVAGEKIDVEVQASGQGEIGTCKLPDLSLQPGFQQSFRIQKGDLQDQEIEGTKRFTFSLIPLTSYVKEIPSIEFSSFDPISKKYVIRKSDPIPIKVLPASSQVQGHGQGHGQGQGQGQAMPISPKLEGNVMLQDSKSETFHMDYILLFYALLFFGALTGVIFVIKGIVEGGKDKDWNSRQLMLEAIKTKSNPDASCKKIKEALLMRLFEANQIKQPISSPQELSNDGLQGDIRKFLLSIEEKQFTGLKVQTEMQMLIEEASTLYSRIKNA